MDSTTIRFAGFGGQGIVKTGEIFGAAAVIDGKHSLQNQAYGSSARGGLCTADVTVESGEIYELEPDLFDVLALLSQDSANAYLGQLSKDGLLIFDDGLVEIPADYAGRKASLSATEIADELGRRIVANMVMLGFCAALTAVVGREALEKTIASHVPEKTIALNLKAFARGWEAGVAAA